MKLLLLIISAMITFSPAVSQEKVKSKVEISGQVMTDIGYNTGQVNPDYFDVMRPTQLPAYKNQYCTDGNVSFGVRLSRIGFKSFTQTKVEEQRPTLL